MCKYQKSKPQPKNIPYPRVQFESECGLKLVLNEGYNTDWTKHHYGHPVNPKGKCMKCQSEIEVVSEEMEKKLNNTNEPHHDAKLPIVRSAYFVSVKGHGDMFVVAENIADACNKLEKITNENYIFIHSKSFECVI